MILSLFKPILTLIKLQGVRDPESAQKSVENFIEKSSVKDRVFYERCDTGDMESVRNFAKKVQEKFSAIHVLINNGEISGIKFFQEIEKDILRKLASWQVHTKKLKTVLSHKWR